MTLRRGCVELLPHQLELVADRTSKIRVLQGGYRSGKTVAGVAAVVDMGFRSEGAPVLVVEPTFRMVLDVFVATATRMLDAWGLPWTYHKSDRILTVGRRRRFEVWCRSADKPRSLEGITAGALLVDEWELCAREALEVAMARVSIGPCQQIVLTGTPEGYGPGYDMVLANKAPTTRVWIVSSKQNSFLRESYVSDMASRLDGDAAEEKLGGHRRLKGGVVYTRFDRAAHTTAPCVRVGEGEVQVWADFNRVGKMAWVVAEADKAGRRAHVVGELIGNNTDTAHQAEQMKGFLAAYLARTRRRPFTAEDVRAMRVPVYCDASGTQEHRGTALSHVALLQQAGFLAKHGQKNPMVVDRINTVQVMLRDRRLTFDAAAAPFSVMCIERQTYVGGAPDKLSGLDHACDAIGYGCHWQFPAWKAVKTEAPLAMQHDEWGIR